MAPGDYFLKPRHADDPVRRDKHEKARAFRRDNVHAPQSVLDAERSLSAH